MKPTRHKTVFNWSGGKDSALALHLLLQDERYDVISLLTTVDGEVRRSSMHDIPLSLLRRQAESIGLPLYTVEMLTRNGMSDYGEAMLRAVEHFKAQGVTHFAFGDIFLHDVKSYREEKLAPHGIEVVEPLWGMTTHEVMETFLASGLQTVIVTTNADVLGEAYIGRRIDAALIGSLPAGCDPCGERGEYHTFCYAGGMFRCPVSYELEGARKMTRPFQMSDGSRREFSYWSARLKA